MLTIPSHKLKAALTHAAKQDIRYYLNGILLEAAVNGDLHIVATDGHRAFIGRIAGGAASWPEFTSLIIPTDAIKAAAKKGDITLASAGARYALGSTLFDAIDGRFPDWRRIVPRGAAQPNEDDWNADYLADAQTALRMWSGRKYAVTRLTPRGKNAGATVTCADDTAFTVLMPVRCAKDEVIVDNAFEPAAAR